jgi:sugar phosphate isomerase/epimerase
MKALRIGVDSYGLIPLHLPPLELLKWAKDNGAEGVQFSGLSPEESRNLDKAYLEDLAQYASSQNLYLEWGGGQHIPFDMETWGKKDIVEVNRNAAREAAIIGTPVVRSCSGGLMRWNPESPQTEMLLEAMADSLRSQRQMLKDHDVILAIETHFEFTTHELLRLFEQCNAEPGDYLGICLDTMNLLTMLENPVNATERILPWVVSTHIKDGAILLNSEGLVTFPAEIGKGIIRIKEIVERIASLPYEVHLTIEDHGGSFSLPIYDSRFLSEFPDLTLQEFVSLIQMGHQAAEAVRAGELAITGREKWPEICESRIKQDMLSLRKLLDL